MLILVGKARKEEPMMAGPPCGSEMVRGAFVSARVRFVRGYLPRGTSLLLVPLSRVILVRNIRQRGERKGKSLIEGGDERKPRERAGEGLRSRCEAKRVR